MFFDKKLFPFTSALESKWAMIKSEFDTIGPEELLAVPWSDLHNQSWEIYSLYRRGRPLKLGCDKLPQTAEFLKTIPGIYNAGFSVLGPHTSITPHVGYTTAVLRCHLGIIVPGDCAIRVGDETYSWKTAEAVVFDDMEEHEAWNKSNEVRVILIIDILKSAYNI